MGQKNKKSKRNKDQSSPVHGEQSTNAEAVNVSATSDRVNETAEVETESAASAEQLNESTNKQSTVQSSPQSSELDPEVLKKENTKLKNNCNAMKSNLNTVKKKYEADLKEVSEENSNLKSKLQSLERDAETLKRENEKLSDNCRNLKSQISSLDKKCDARMKRVSEENRHLKSKVDSMEKDNEYLRKKIEAAGKEIEDLKRRNVTPIKSAEVPMDVDLQGGGEHQQEQQLKMPTNETTWEGAESSASENYTQGAHVDPYQPVYQESEMQDTSDWSAQAAGPGLVQGYAQAQDGDWSADGENEQPVENWEEHTVDEQNARTKDSARGKDPWTSEDTSESTESGSPSLRPTYGAALQQGREQTHQRHDAQQRGNNRQRPWSQKNDVKQYGHQHSEDATGSRPRQGQGNFERHQRVFYGEQQRDQRYVQHAQGSWGEGNHHQRRDLGRGRGDFHNRGGADNRYRDNQRGKFSEKFKVLKEVTGDLFMAPDDNSLAHCVAEDMRMGSGIAVTFRQKYKRVAELLDQRRRQGQVAILEDNGRYIYYLVTKPESTGKPTMVTLERSLCAMRDHVVEQGVKKIAMPRIGCGLDRLRWHEVKPLIEKIFSETGATITVYNYEDTSASTPESLQDASASKPKPASNVWVKNAYKPVSNIERLTAILCLCAADGSVDSTLELLDRKFRLLDDYRNMDRKLGTILEIQKPNYHIYLLIVKQKKQDTLSFTAFAETLVAACKLIDKHKYEYVAVEAFNDKDDELIMEKVITILREYLDTKHPKELWICWPENVSNRPQARPY